MYTLDNFNINFLKISYKNITLKKIPQHMLKSKIKIISKRLVSIDNFKDPKLYLLNYWDDMGVSGGIFHNNNLLPYLIERNYLIKTFFYQNFTTSGMWNLDYYAIKFKILPYPSYNSFNILRNIKSNKQRFKLYLTNLKWLRLFYFYFSLSYHSILNKFTLHKSILLNSYTKPYCTIILSFKKFNFFINIQDKLNKTCFYLSPGMFLKYLKKKKL